MIEGAVRKFTGGMILVNGKQELVNKKLADIAEALLGEGQEEKRDCIEVFLESFVDAVHVEDDK